MNRLSSVTYSNYSRSFQYDAYGNMWVSAFSGIGPQGNTPQSDVYHASNQIGPLCTQAGSSYDCAGNLLVANGETLAYDAENRQISATEPAALGGATETYLYDGDGRRVAKTRPAGATVFVYDALGKLAAEYASAANTSPCTTCYLTWNL